MKSTAINQLLNEIYSQLQTGQKKRLLGGGGGGGGGGGCMGGGSNKETEMDREREREKVWDTETVGQWAERDWRQTDMEGRSLKGKGRSENNCEATLTLAKRPFLFSIRNISW